MTFKVTVLGNGSASPSVDRNQSAHALNVHEQFYLVDCGEGTQSRLHKYQISLMRLNAIFLTHLHGDHSYGIFPLLSSLELMGRKTPLKIFAPHPFGQLLDSVSELLGEKYDYQIQFHEVNTREHTMIYENKVMEVWTIPLRHRVPTSGYLFREKIPPLNIHKDKIEKYNLGIAQIVTAKRGEDIELDSGEILRSSDLTYVPYTPRSYAYCSDTLRSGKVAKIVSGVDLLYHEATFLHEDKLLAKASGHTTALEAGRLAKQADVEQLLIGHFSSRYGDLNELLLEAQSEFPNTRLAIEGDTIEIPVKKFVE